MRTLVERWQGRPNIIGWDVFSELNLITGATEVEAVAFAEAARSVVRAADLSLRPVTASRAGNVALWPTLSSG